MNRNRLMLLIAFLAPSPVLGEVHKVEAKVYYRTFFRGHPVLQRIKPGALVPQFEACHRLLPIANLRARAEMTSHSGAEINHQFLNRVLC